MEHLPSDLSPRNPPTLAHDIAYGLMCYLCSTLVLFFAVLFGHTFLKSPPGQETPGATLEDCFARFDGENYKRIVRDGYIYDPARRSSVAFFPVYPLLATFVQKATGLSPVSSLLVVAHVSLACAFVLLLRYARLCCPNRPPEFAEDVAWAFAFFPPTFFFRMAYAEATFFCLLLLVLIGMEKRWSPLLLALLIGIVTATRPVGVAFLPAFAVHLWSVTPRLERGLGFFLRLLGLLLLSSWGLLTYMSFLAGAFDEPLAFALAQENWQIYKGDWGKWESLLTLEPLWGLFVPGSARHWANFDPYSPAWFSIMPANVFFFLFALASIGVAWKAKLASPSVVVLGLGLLAIPYFTRAYEMSLGSMARFSVLVPSTYFFIALAFQNTITKYASFAFCSTVYTLWITLFITNYLIY